MIVDQTSLDQAFHFDNVQSLYCQKKWKYSEERRGNNEGKDVQELFCLLLKLQLIFRGVGAYVEREVLPKPEFQHCHLVAVTMGLVYHFFLPLVIYSHKNGNNDRSFFRVLVWELNEILVGKCLK